MGLCGSRLALPPRCCLQLLRQRSHFSHGTKLFDRDGRNQPLGSGESLQRRLVFLLHLGKLGRHVVATRPGCFHGSLGRFQLALNNFELIKSACQVGCLLGEGGHLLGKVSLRRLELSHLGLCCKQLGLHPTELGGQLCAALLLNGNLAFGVCQLLFGLCIGPCHRGYLFHCRINLLFSFLEGCDELAVCLLQSCRLRAKECELFALRLHF
mmetsp:Transcript_33035/g.86407  ORF Transcript_33035/g.86407 Transcript_33035/m.86407 type:complete len:211 (+) Transcript_33035:577-1209(+)